MPGANRPTLHVLAVAAEHERHMIGERTRHALAAAKARHQARQSKAGRAQALRPHIERCIEAVRTSSSAIATDLNERGIATPNGGRWFPVQVRRVPLEMGTEVALYTTLMCNSIRHL
jgi:DNA invertase Pin-like site-specific DNA recombinase